MNIKPLAKTSDLAKGMKYHISQKRTYLGIGTCLNVETKTFALNKDATGKRSQRKVNADEWDFI